MHTSSVACVTYPARPMNGGRLETALPLPGQWMFSRKVNGWRTLVHTPTGTMFNRRGEELSIANQFGPALEQLRRCESAEWLDCEAFDRRHPFGRGTLVILDVVTTDMDGADRLMSLNCLARELGFDILPYGEAAAPNTVYMMNQRFVMDQRRATSPSEMLDLWGEMQEWNKAIGDVYYEGLVAKRASAPYPIQTVDPDRKSISWMKYRFVR